jgi:hypothetical protein
LLAVEVAVLFSRIREDPFVEVIYWIAKSDAVSVIVLVPALIKTSSLAVGTPLGDQLPAVVHDVLVLLKVFVAACAEWPSSNAVTATVKDLATSEDGRRNERVFMAEGFAKQAGKSGRLPVI